MRPVLIPWGLAVLTVLVLIAPILGATHLPFIDLPNHLARHYLAAHLDEIPELQRFYAFSNVLLPNSGGDILRALLGWDGDIYLFGRITACLYLVNLVASLMVLHRVLWGAWSAMPLAGGLAAWNGLFWFGFENFCMALPFVLHGLALWIGLERRAPVLRAVLLTILAGAVYFIHIFAFGLLAVVVGLHELGRRPFRLSATVLAAFAFVPVAAHFLIVVVGRGAGHGGEWTYGEPLDRLAVLSVPFSRLPFWFPRPGETALLLVLFAAFAVGTLLLHRLGWVRLHPRLVWPVAGLAIMCLVVPKEVMGLQFIQIRAPVLLVLIVLAGLGWQGAPARGRAAAGAIIAGLFLWQAWLDNAELRYRDQQRQSFIAAIEVIQPGDSVISISDEPTAWLWGVRHMPALVLIERHAAFANLFNGANGVTVTPEWLHASHPHLGMIRPALLIEARQEFLAGRDYTHPEVIRTYWRTWWRDFTHVIQFGSGDLENPIPDLLEEVARGDVFVIYKVIRPD